MCAILAILDASVVGKVFHERRSEAGREFIKWINSGRGSLVTGGKLRDELNISGKFRLWWQEAVRAVRAGRARKLDDAKEGEVRNRTKKLIATGACKSNDHHVIALAQVSGVRFLYSDDADLHEDFGNKRLIDNPGGTVYSTKETDAFTRAHKAMLRKRTCRI